MNVNTSTQVDRKCLRLERVERKLCLRAEL